MTVREFIQHLILNCELDDLISIEATIDRENAKDFLHFIPTHAYHLDGNESIIEAKESRYQ